MATNNKVYKNKNISKSTKSRIKKLEKENLILEIENAELKDQLYRLGENPNQLNLDFEIDKTSKIDFEVKAKELCSPKTYSTLDKKIEILEIIFPK